MRLSEAAIKVTKYTKLKKTALSLIMTGIMMGSVAGCGASLAETAEEPVAKVTTNSKVVPSNSEYKVLFQTPGIHVDQLGYDTESDKTVVFSARELPREFEIKSLESGETLYTGEIIKSVFDEKSGLTCGIGRFNDFVTEGEYYCYADGIGESYSFAVKEGILNDAFDLACKKYYINRCGTAVSPMGDEPGHSACHTTAAKLQENNEVQLDVTGGWHMDEKADRESLLGSRISENLMLAYEMNSKAFTDDSGIPESGNGIPDILDEVRYEIEWLLKMQDSKTGGVYGAAVTQGDAGSDTFALPVVVTGVNMDATISFASTMAKFSFLYQQYDPEFATTTLKAADRAYECFLNNHKVSDNTAVFKAATQLYRATGNTKYSDVMEEFFGMKDFSELFYEDENIFLGAVTYLSTSRNVDKNKCNELIKLLMGRSEKIAGNSTNSPYLVSNRGDEDLFAKLLDDMRCLCITNHIIYNHEYKTIIENHLHYLMGMNEASLNYVTEDTENSFVLHEGKNGLMNDPQSDALLVFMMSGVTAEK